jgi:hypothetical protein
MSDGPMTVFLKDVVQRHVEDHEVFLDFRSDLGAELWREWWRVAGEPAYQEWATAEIERRLAEEMGDGEGPWPEGEIP